MSRAEPITFYVNECGNQPLKDVCSIVRKFCGYLVLFTQLILKNCCVQ